MPPRACAAVVISGRVESMVAYSGKTTLHDSPVCSGGQGGFPSRGYFSLKADLIIRSGRALSAVSVFSAIGVIKPQVGRLLELTHCHRESYSRAQCDPIWKRDQEGSSEFFGERRARVCLMSTRCKTDSHSATQRRSCVPKDFLVYGVQRRKRG